jgi:transcriptional regulator with XRE-family HTH domain
VLRILSKKYQTPGTRLRTLREALNLTREEFCHIHKMSYSTLRALENSGLELTPKHANKLIDAFKREGIICTEEWLLKGIGPFPIPGLIDEDIHQEQPSTSPYLYQPKKALIREIDFFQRNNPDALVIQVADDTMYPFFHTKDYIGGIKVDVPVKQVHYGQPCIVNLQDGQQLTRILYPGTQDNLFNLGYPYPADLNKHPFIINVPLTAIYRIVWHRKGF